jgi:antitoxin (DNA-binding transcriptional repressor) of toxin-antitoxin stability system
MITIGLEQATLDQCLDEAQHERVVITRNGKPIALLVNIEGLDEEQLELGSSNTFWKLITERRSQPTISRTQLEQTIDDME